MIVCKQFYNIQNSILFILTVSILLLQSSCAQTDTPTESKLRSPLTLRGTCPLGAVIESADGVRRLALIIGVGKYKKTGITKLPGATQDAKRFYKLLTNEKGYGFPKENVCLLLDEDANTERVKTMFMKSLVQHARPQDVAVFYYAGHGSQVTDKNNDESDKMDETFVFYDARTNGVKDFPDDEFNQLLQNLYEKTQHITVFLDSCNSGSATRGDDNFITRYLPPEEEETRKIGSDTISNTLDTEDQNVTWVSDSMPKIVFFSAASDGTSALERDGHGIFTDAIITVLAPINATKRTYAQAARQIRQLVKAESYQIPYFQGELQRSVFANVSRKQPIGWEIISTKPNLTLGGFPLPGISRGAEFRVYDDSIEGADTQNPERAKAIIVIDEMQGLNANAHILSHPADAEEIQPGDLAVMIRPGDSQLLLSVTLRSAKKSGGISVERARKIAVELEKQADARKAITLVKKRGDFELSLNDEGLYVIKGPENVTRKIIKSEKGVINNLWQHAVQRALIALRGEGGKEFVDNQTLQVEIVPAAKQNNCAIGSWVKSTVDSTQPEIIPLGCKWHVKVTLKDGASEPLLIGGLVLSTDGSTFGFPYDGRIEKIKSGESVVFNKEIFTALPPLNIEDQIIVFGTKEKNPVSWHLLNKPVGERSGESKNALYSALDRYLQPGKRGTGIDIVSDNTDTTWTLSAISLRVRE